MVEITLHLDKSVEQNAEVYYEKSKRLKKKIAGIQAIISKTKKQLGELQERKEKKIQESNKPVRKKAWYEKFRWFVSSEGFLVIGGRDATTNEIVIKKHTEPTDIVFHTDMAGSPFFVVKSEGKTIGKDTLSEVADATFTFSRAGKSEITTSQVFYVNPDQVTKTPNAGESLPKGAFVIRGKTNYIENKWNIAVGLYESALMAAPLESVKKHCEKYLVLQKGEKKPSDVAKMVRKLIGGELDEIIRALPSSNLNIKK